MENWQQQLDDLSARDMLRRLRTVSGIQGPRVVLDGREVLMLCSNNYLGLASHPKLIEAANRATTDFGVGSSGSRLISGSMELHARFEERLASFKGSEAALLYNSGYAANTGILQGLFGEDDVLFSDSLNHASIIDGCRLSKARTVIYPHADVKSLEALMETEMPKRKGRWAIVTDGVFSMDGDIAPLAALARLKEKYDALLMIDDAHGSGVLGATGRGSGEHCGCLHQVDLHMGTLGKGFGCFGAYLAGSRVIIDTLINRSRPFIFSTSLPPAVPAAAMAALDIVESPEGAELRRLLRRNRECLTTTLRQHGCDISGSETHIVPVITGQPEPTMAAAEALLEQGIFIQGIRPPTVPAGACRLRGTVMATHNCDDLEEAARAIAATIREVNA